MKPSLLLLTSLVSTSALFATAPDFSAAKAKSPLKIDFVTVADPGNVADRNGHGSVAEVFEIGKFDVTAEQYCAFLNAVASKEDPYELYDERMTTDKDVASIDRTGDATTGYTYTPKPNCAKLPVVYVSWFSAARFCNWLNNGQPKGSEDASTTETGAYTLNGAMKDIPGDLNTPPSDYAKVTEGAKYYLPTEDQYYKAAYFKRVVNNSDSGYWTYATKSDKAPSNGNESFSPNNEVNYFIETNKDNNNQWFSAGVRNNKYTTRGKQPFLTEVGSFKNTVSPYGAYDMAGNVSQWLSGTPGVAACTRPIRGGCWGPAPLSKEDQKNYDMLSKSNQLYKFFRTDGKGQCPPGEVQLNKETIFVIDSSVRRDYIGFRVAHTPQS